MDIGTAAALRAGLDTFREAMGLAKGVQGCAGSPSMLAIVTRVYCPMHRSLDMRVSSSGMFGSRSRSAVVLSGLARSRSTAGRLVEHLVRRLPGTTRRLSHRGTQPQW